MSQPYNVKPGDLVEVEWLDPAAGSYWEDAKTVTALWKMQCRSIGWVHLADNVGLVLMACYSEDDDGDRSILLRQHFPWSCVEKLWIVEILDETK